MASTIFSKLSPQLPETAQATPTTDTTNPVSSLINQIMGSANPQQMFQQMVTSNPNAKSAMDIVNQYGNGDPKAAFMNHMSQQGKQVVGQQNDLMLQTNNTNQINMLQGFNSIVLQLQNQTAQLGSKVDNLGYQMENCCCSIKTQMLQDRLADKAVEAVALQNKIDNRDQTQTILGQLGRFVAWAGSGAPAATGTVAG